MAYSDFTLIKFKNAFQIETASESLFDTGLPLFEVSNRLIEDLNESRLIPVSTEKAKSELLITPLLKELKRKNAHFSFFSGFVFNVDAQRGLTGVPDFIFSSSDDNLIEIEGPIFCLVEAKNGIVEEGIGQCAAEMYASRLFNQQTGNAHDLIYGAVTNAFDWVFMKLEGDTLTIDTNRYFLNDLPRLLGILHYIVNRV